MAVSKKVLIQVGDLTTTDATVTTIITVAIPTGKNVVGFLLATSRNTSNTNTKTFTGSVYGKNVGGTVTVASSLTNLVTDEATNVTVTNSGTNMIIQVTGIAATTIDWMARFEFIEN